MIKLGSAIKKDTTNGHPRESAVVVATDATLEPDLAAKLSGAAKRTVIELLASSGNVQFYEVTTLHYGIDDFIEGVSGLLSQDFATYQALVSKCQTLSSR